MAASHLCDTQRSGAVAMGHVRSGMATSAGQVTDPPLEMLSIELGHLLVMSQWVFFLALGPKLVSSQVGLVAIAGVSLLSLSSLRA